MERKAAKLQMEWNKVPDRLNRKLYLPSDRTDLYEMLTLWGVIVLTSVLILLGTAQKMFSLLALGLAAYATVFGKDANTVILLVAITPIANIFKASPGSTSFHTYLMLLYSLKTFLVKKSLNAVSVLFAIFFIAVQFATYHLETTTTIKLMSNIWFLDAAYKEWSRKEPSKLFYGFILGVFNCSIFRMMDSHVFQVTRYVAVENLSRIYGLEGGVRFSGCYNDPNYYSVNLIIAICLIVLLLKDKRIPRILATALILFFLYCAYLTYSKSALAMMLLPLILYVYQNIKERHIYKVGMTVICLIGGLMWLLKSKPEMFDIVIARMSEGSGGGLNALTTGRTDIWMWYFEYFLMNPVKFLFGGGDYKFSPVHGRASHNTPIEMLYHLGLIGSALFVAVGATIFEEYHVRHRRSFMNYSVALCVFIMYMFLSELFLIDIPVHILLSFLVMDLPSDKDDAIFLEMQRT